MIVRRLTPDDAVKWREFRLEMLRAHPRAYGSTLVEAEKTSLEGFAQALTDIHMFVAEADELIGSVGWHPLSGQAVRHRGQVISAYLRPGNRGAGIIDKIMDAVVADAKAHVLQLELVATSDNYAAIKAYERNGFHRIGLTPRGLRQGDEFADDVHMLRRLDA